VREVQRPPTSAGRFTFKAPLAAAVMTTSNAGSRSAPSSRRVGRLVTAVGSTRRAAPPTDGRRHPKRHELASETTERPRFTHRFDYDDDAPILHRNLAIIDAVLGMPGDGRRGARARGRARVICIMRRRRLGQLQALVVCSKQTLKQPATESASRRPLPPPCRAYWLAAVRT